MKTRPTDPVLCQNSAQLASTKEPCLSKSNSNSSTRTGYAASRQHLTAEAPIGGVVGSTGAKQPPIHDRSKPCNQGWIDFLRSTARSGRQECRRWSEAAHGRQRNRPGTTRSPTDVALVPAQPDPSRALAAPRGPRPRCPGTSGTAWSAQPVSPKELRLSKSGSNFSARAGYAAATN